MGRLSRCQRARPGEPALLCRHVRPSAALCEPGLKAVIAIGAYAQLCERAGKAEEARKFMAIARQYAGIWQNRSADQGRTRLAYHLPGSWGMKHNLIWDRVLGLNLFPESVGDDEIAWYLKVQKKYGLPVDSRTDTSLIDWALWSITPGAGSATLSPLSNRSFAMRTRRLHACRYRIGSSRRTGARRDFRRVRLWAGFS